MRKHGEESPALLCIVLECGKKGGHLWRRRRQCGKLRGQIEICCLGAISLLFVFRERLLKRLTSAEPSIDGLCQPLRTAESVRDPGSRAGILLISGIAH